MYIYPKSFLKLPDNFWEKSKFHENLHVFGVMKKPMRQYNFFYNAQTDTTGAFLDNSWANLGLKIAPESIEFTDSEISSFLWSTWCAR